MQVAEADREFLARLLIAPQQFQMQRLLARQLQVLAQRGAQPGVAVGELLGAEIGIERQRAMAGEQAGADAKRRLYRVAEAGVVFEPAGRQAIQPGIAPTVPGSCRRRR